MVTFTGTLALPQTSRVSKGWEETPFKSFADAAGC